MRHLLSTAALAVVMGALPTLATAQSTQSDVGCPGEFPVADSNQDGMITGKEASAAMLSEFSMIDADGSGDISIDEWRACGNAGMRTMMDAKASDLQAGDHAPRQEGMQTMMDAERSDLQAGDHAPGQEGSASAAESAGAAPLNEEGPPRPWWSGDEPFQAADTDDSGTVSRAEAANAAEFAYGQSQSGQSQSGQSQSGQSKSGKSAEDAARRSGARFAVLDTNGDGVISEREWKNRDQADIRSIFARLDQDDNDKLSKREFHQATDRGPASDEPVTIWYYYTY